MLLLDDSILTMLLLNDAILFVYRKFLYLLISVDMHLSVLIMRLCVKWCVGVLSVFLCRFEFTWGTEPSLLISSLRRPSVVCGGLKRAMSKRWVGDVGGCNELPAWFSASRLGCCWELGTHHNITCHSLYLRQETNPKTQVRLGMLLDFWHRFSAIVSAVSSNFAYLLCPMGQLFQSFVHHQIKSFKL